MCLTMFLVLVSNRTSQAITVDASSQVADVTSAVTYGQSTSAVGNISLADGSDGQIKTFINVSTSGTNNVVITPTNFRGGTTITLNAEGETVTCLFKNAKWNIIASHGDPVIA